MTPEFFEGFHYLIGNEGTTFTETTGDAGGPTKFGVTQKSYAEYLGRDVTPEEIAGLTINDAQTFYWAMYWLKLSCDKMKSLGVAVAVFDSGVLYGIGTAALLAQKAVSLLSGSTSLKLDGILGDNSVSLINLCQTAEFLKTYQILILKRIDAVIVKDPVDEKFRDGWTNRADRLLTLNDLSSLNGSTS